MLLRKFTNKITENWQIPVYIQSQSDQVVSCGNVWGVPGSSWRIPSENLQPSGQVVEGVPEEAYQRVLVFLLDSDAAEQPLVSTYTNNTFIVYSNPISLTN